MVIMRKRMLVTTLLWSMAMAGCSLSGGEVGRTDADSRMNAETGSAGIENAGIENADSAYAGQGNGESGGEGQIGMEAAEPEPVRPTKEEVLAMRELVLEGMSEEEIKRLTENIKVANHRMESGYLYDSLFEKLEDKESLYWNYFDEKGEIQVGWEYEGSYREMKAVMDKENLSQEEFNVQYGTPVMVYNRFDAENFMELMEEMKALVHNEKLKEDLQQLIDETSLAAENHEMEHASNIYKILHDMDYYLLRYGLEDVGQYVQDTSTIAKYYGVLSVYE